MFVGHYAAALGAKAASPRAPLWVFVGACQLLDLVWAPLVLAGAEHMRLNPGLPGSPLDLYSMPYTHSLPGALALSVLGAAFARWIVRMRGPDAALAGAVVFSHWLLDLLVHRPDLSLGFGGTPKVGLGLWNAPGLELAIEMGLLVLAAAWWTGVRARRGGRLWPALSFLAFLVLLQVVGEVNRPSSVPMFAVTALVAYVAATGAAWWLDRGEPARRLS